MIEIDKDELNGVNVTYIEDKISIYNKMRLDFLNRPFDFWKLYKKQMLYRPILITGHRGTAKNEVALQICQCLDNDFDIDKNIIRNSEDFIKNIKKKSTYLISSDKCHMNRRINTEKNIQFMKLMQTGRANETFYCLLSNTVSSISNYILNYIQEYINVVKTFKDYHIVEILTFTPPFSLNDLVNAPKLESMEDDEYVEYVNFIITNTNFWLMKYPRLNGDEIDV